jgi:uncharacterized protein (TIGR03067 family)
MKLRALLMLLAVGFLVAADDKDDAVKKEKAKLKGTYKMVSGEEQGMKLPDDYVTNTKVEFTNDKMIIKVVKDKDEKNVEATYKIDPGQKIKTIDLKPTDGPEKGKTIKGIYVIDGDTLKICAASKSDNDRPKVFATEKGSGSVLMVLKKEKGKEKAKE